MKMFSRDLSDLEDSQTGFKVIEQIVMEAAKSAVAEAQVAGLPLVFVRDNKIIRITSNGGEESIEAGGSNVKDFFIRIKPGTVFHASKK